MAGFRHSRVVKHLTGLLSGLSPKPRGAMLRRLERRGKPVCETPTPTPPPAAPSTDQFPRTSRPIRIGHYRILKELGRGGMGTVYAARDESTNRDVAVKVIRQDRVVSESAVRRFYQEAQCLGGLNHPNIPRLIETSEGRSGVYYVMDYVDGQPLDEAAKQRRGDLEWRLTTAYKIALSLQHIHEHGLVHLDVKPSNILIDARGEPHLIDFGIAHRMHQKSHALVEKGEQEHETGGTPLYMAPEQVLAPESVDQRTDVYSLGIVLYELLTGVRPYRGNGTEDIMSRILLWDPIAPRMLNPHIPAAIEAILLKAMDKNLTRRYQTADDLARDLKSAIVRLAIRRRVHHRETSVTLPAIKHN